MKITAGSNGVFGPWTGALRAQEEQSSITVRCDRYMRIQIGVGPSGVETVVTDANIGAGTSAVIAIRLNPGDRVAIRAIAGAVGSVDVEVSSSK